MGFEKSFKPSSKDVQAFLGAQFCVNPCLFCMVLTYKCNADILDVQIFRSNKVLFNDVARRIGKLVIDQVSWLVTV
jgi:hypothetical protein